MQNNLSLPSWKMKVKMNKLIKIACMLLSLCLLLTACIADEEEERGTQNLEVGEHIPSFAVVMDDARVLTDKDLAGKVSLIAFFHTGCPDCRQELPVLQQIYEVYKERVNVVCISREQSEPEIRSYWTEQGFTLPYSAQEDRVVYHLFAMSSIPRIYITDEASVIRYVFTDDPLAGYEVLVAAMKELGI